MHIFCPMAAAHVTTVSLFAFTLWLEESLVALPHCCVLVHLLVPELIMKGWEGWNLLLAVCSSWTRGHKANEPCLSRLQLANMRVSINGGSNWETFSQIPARWLFGWGCWQKRATLALVWLFWPNFACELEAEELFCTVCPVIKRLS